MSNPYSFSYLTFAGMGLSGGAGRPAIQLIDPWGNFIVYDEKAAYVNQQKGGPSLNDVYEDTDYVGVTFTSGGTWDSDPAYKLPFMIFSYGANGTDDTSDASTADSIEHGDDIGNW
ncbi:MAG: hypothetical protein U5N86_08370 [Planctomycetota bacterium]|nr:hypothetical protein [Planctomycetota bacterium]